MVAIKNTFAGLIIAALATSAAAAKCEALGSITRGATLSSGFSVRRDGDVICRFDGQLKCGSLPNGNENVIDKCKDLKHPVSFHADCPGSSSFKGCQVDYGDDKGIEGKESSASQASTCEVEFDC